MFEVVEPIPQCIVRQGDLKVKVTLILGRCSLSTHGEMLTRSRGIPNRGRGSLTPEMKRGTVNPQEEELSGQGEMRQLALLYLPHFMKPIRILFTMRGCMAWVS